MPIAESVMVFFTSTISTIINFFISQILPMQNPPPPSSSTIDSELEAVVLNVSEQDHSESHAVTTPVAPDQNLDSESQAVVALNVSEQNRSESQAVVVPRAPDQNWKQLMLEWQKAVMAFCFTSALEIAVLSAQIKSQLSVSFHFLSFAILLVFLSLFIANFISHSTTTQVLEMVAIMLVATTIVFTITISFPLSLRCVTWSLYAISLFIVFICRYGI